MRTPVDGTEARTDELTDAVLVPTESPHALGVGRWREKIATMNLRVAVEAGRVAGLALLLVASAMLMAAGTYNPFIYFRF